jgi:AcrR family transcriptional regulator
MPKISDEKKQARHRQILSAAARRFGRQGFQQTTIHDICAEAKLSPGAVYTYFASKEAIVEAMAQLGEDRAASRMVAVKLEADPVARLKAYLRELDRRDAAVVNQYDLRIWAEAIGNSAVRKPYLRTRAAVLDGLISVVAEPAAARGIDPQAMAEMVLAFVQGCEVRKAIEPAADVAPALEALIALLAV